MTHFEKLMRLFQEKQQRDYTAYRVKRPRVISYNTVGQHPHRQAPVEIITAEELRHALNPGGAVDDAQRVFMVRQYELLAEQAMAGRDPLPGLSSAGRPGGSADPSRPERSGGAADECFPDVIVDPTLS